MTPARVSDGSARGNEESPEAPLRAEIPFLNVGRFLASRGIAVPAIYAAEESHGVILLEDLGDLALAEAAALAPPAEREAVLGPAIDLLAELASLHSADPAGCYAFESEYGGDAIARELQVVATHGLAHARGLGVLSAGDDAPLEEALAPTSSGHAQCVAERCGTACDSKAAPSHSKCGCAAADAEVV